MMVIKIHRGPSLTVPRKAGVRRNTQLIVAREPGSKTIAALYTLGEFRDLFLPEEPHFYGFEDDEWDIDYTSGGIWSVR